MKKIISLFLILITLFTISFAASNNNEADNIIGVYWSPKKDAKIEIYKKENKYFGKSIWTSTKRKDFKNPNPSLKERDLLGAELFTSFIYKDGIYQDGKIYDLKAEKHMTAR